MAVTTVDVATRPAQMDGCWATWAEQDEPAVIRTTMEDGTVKVRRRNTGRHRVAKVSRTFKAVDYTNFMDWFNIACQQGVKPTRMKTPYDADEVWRFSSPPEIVWLEPAAFAVSCNIEQLAGWDKL